MKQLKIGFFIQNSRRGGLDTFLINLINNFKTDCNLVIIYNKNHDGIIDYKKKINRDINYVTYDYLLSQDINENKILNLLPNYIKKIIRYYLLLSSIIFKPYYFFKIFEKINLDRLLIINGGYQGGEACNSAAIAWKNFKPKFPAWYSFHNFAIKNKRSIHLVENIIRNFIDKKIKHSVRGFISVSKVCLKSLNFRKNLYNIDKKLIYNGLKIEKEFKIKSSNSHLKKKNYHLVMLAVYEERKGFKFIIEVIKIITKKINKIKLFIHGDGSEIEKNKILNLIKKEKLEKNIFLYKFTNNNDKIYKKADLVVIPSQYDEPFGYVAIESFYYKKPVIACKTGGLNEVIIDNNSGFLVNKNNPKKFAAKIINVLTNINLKKKLIKNGSIRLKSFFTAEKMSQKYLKLIIND
jgi:glycosyltransferase involved in cell wall biosynthesis